MNPRFVARKGIYPLLAIFLSLFMLVVTMILSKNNYAGIVLLSMLVIFLFFGYHKAVLAVIPILIVFGLIFVLPKFFIKPFSLLKIVKSANRICAFIISLVPILGIKPLDLVRSMREMHVTKKIILASLILFNFLPLVRYEIKNCKIAIKTRAVKRHTSPNILYRAYLIPFITNLIRMSEIISMSVETRGFTLSKTRDTIYTRPKLGFKDFLFYLLFVAGMGVSIYYG